jgi:hypothetical protein
VPVVDWFGEDTKEGGYGGDVQINHVVLQSGKYKVVGKMYPRYGQKFISADEYLSIDFDCADFDNWKASRHKFQSTVEIPWDGLSENINYPAYEISTEIDVQLPFVLDGWQNSVNLQDLNKTELRKEVLAFYRQIHAVLSEHNISKYMELSKEKKKLQEQAFYFTDERKKSFLEGMVEVFNKNMPMEPLNENELELQLMGYGKLVRLLKKDYTQPLQFKSPDLEKQSNIELEIMLHKRDSNKGFTII